MGRLTCLIALCAAASAAAAGGYDQFGAGIDANNRGAPAEAAAHFTRALAAGDLSDSYVPAALLGRARAFLRQTDCAAALRDLDSALQRKPEFADALSLRAETHACRGEDAAALADADAAVKLKPSAGYLFIRSRLYWNHGDFQKAHSDAEAAAARDAGNGYFRLWSAVTGLALERTPGPSDAPQTTIGDWPGPLLALFGGRTTPEAVWQEAANDNGRACEADFYVGTWHQSRGERAAARELYTRAAERCPKDFVAFDAARRALKRLD